MPLAGKLNHTDLNVNMLSALGDHEGIFPLHDPITCMVRNKLCWGANNAVGGSGTFKNKGKSGWTGPRTVYKGLYNWPEETIGKQHKQCP